MLYITPDPRCTQCHGPASPYHKTLLTCSTDPERHCYPAQPLPFPSLGKGAWGTQRAADRPTPPSHPDHAFLTDSTAQTSASSCLISRQNCRCPSNHQSCGDQARLDNSERIPERRKRRLGTQQRQERMGELERLAARDIEKGGFIPRSLNHRSVFW